MIVMKFGGTSVADAAAITRTISIVEGKLAQKPVMVVSACAKVTDSLYKKALLRLEIMTKRLQPR